MKIRVPATSANLGCGFDSIGLALQLYLTVEVGDETSQWRIEHDLAAEIPTDERNLIVATALKVAPNLPAHHLRMTSDIPLEHGLGSSSSAIIAGIQLADKLGNLHLSIDQKLRIACQLEGHPDNVAPALLGGLVVASYSKRQLSYQKLRMPECAIVATVPAYNVSTEKARALLSKTFSRRKAVIASSRANVMVAALANGDLSAAGEQMEQDLFHEPYRRALIPELEKIRELGHIHGAYASYLSGAGSTVVTLLDNSATVSFIEAAKPFGQVLSLSVDKKGAKYE